MTTAETNELNTCIKSKIILISLLRLQLTGLLSHFEKGRQLKSKINLNLYTDIASQELFCSNS